MRIGIEIRLPGRQESGQQRYLWRLGAWLAQSDHEVHYLTILDHNPDTDPPPGARLHRLGDLGRRPLQARIRDLRLDVLLLNPERSHRFRGIRANVLRPAYGTQQYRQKLRSFRAPHTAFFRRVLRVTPWVAIQRWWERAFYERPDPPPQVIAVSRYMKDEILDSYRVPADHVHVIHNGVDLNEFNPARRQELRADERARWGIPADAVCVLFMGHNFRLKGLWPLLDVVRRVRQEAPGPDLHLLVAGRGTGRWQRGRAERFIARHGLDSAVHIAGPIRPAIRAFAAADIFAHLSWHDAFGFVTLEAMASGVPVITTPYIGAAEIVDHGTSGYLVDPADRDAIVRYVHRLLDPAERRRVGSAAMEEGRRHPEEANFARVLEVFRTAASRSAGPIA